KRHAVLGAMLGIGNAGQEEQIGLEVAGFGQIAEARRAGAEEKQRLRQTDKRRSRDLADRSHVALRRVRPCHHSTSRTARVTCWVPIRPYSAGLAPLPLSSLLPVISSRNHFR